uniref:G-protein coupled receptors family 1 profile domain-containing protein n=1 Tax=Gouania willdenowi TaxID=441366 RepID=A0A8C5E021_GOUWI
CSRLVTLQSSQKVNRSELKAARTLGVVVVVFLMCLTPLYLVLLTTGFGVKSVSSYIFVLGLFYFNSLLNPVIYVFLYPWFRKCVKCVLSLQILKCVSSEANILIFNSRMCTWNTHSLLYITVLRLKKYCFNFGAAVLCFICTSFMVVL